MSPFDPASVDRQRWIMPAVLLLVGLPFLLGGLALAGAEWRFRSTADRVEGRIIGSGGGDSYRLIVAYQSRDGTRHTLESAGSDLYRDYVEGMTVPVWVDRQYPARARLGLFVDAWLIATVLSVFGAFFTLPALGMGWAMSAKVRRRWRLRVRGQTHAPSRSDVVPLLPDFFAQAARGTAMQTLNLQLENGQWRLLVNGRPENPLAENAARDYGLRYALEVEWTDPSTGHRHRTRSAPLELPPDRRLREQARVLALPGRPDSAEVIFTAPGAGQVTTARRSRF